MMCGRCGGFMVLEPIPDATRSNISSEPNVTRCLNCGNMEDAVIFTNRLEPRLVREATRYKICPDVEPSR
jgi:hypothetical protein